MCSLTCSYACADALIDRDVGDDDLLNVETEKSDKKSLEELLNETDSMFKEVEDKTAAMDLNVDEPFNFDDYINQQGAGDDD